MLLIKRTSAITAGIHVRYVMASDHFKESIKAHTPPQLRRPSASRCSCCSKYHFILSPKSSASCNRYSRESFILRVPHRIRLLTCGLDCRGAANNNELPPAKCTYQGARNGLSDSRI